MQPYLLAEISTTTTNMVSDMEGAFDAAGAVGIAILGLLIAVFFIGKGLSICKIRSEKWEEPDIHWGP